MLDPERNPKTMCSGRHSRSGQVLCPPGPHPVRSPRRYTSSLSRRLSGDDAVAGSIKLQVARSRRRRRWHHRVGATVLSPSSEPHPTLRTMVDGGRQLQAEGSQVHRRPHLTARSMGGPARLYLQQQQPHRSNLPDGTYRTSSAYSAAAMKGEWGPWLITG